MKKKVVVELKGGGFGSDSTTHELSLFLFENVTNSSDLLQQLKTGSLELAFIDPSLIASTLQLWAAANLALFAKQNGRLRTRNLHTELVYNLSPERNIRNAYKELGISETSTAMIVATFNSDPSHLQKIQELVKGEDRDIDQELRRFFDFQKASKVYQLSKEEEEGDAVAAIINRISTKGVL